MMEWKDLPVVEMTLADCIYVCTNMRKEDYLETASLSFEKTRDEIARGVINQLGESYTILNSKKEPVLIGGTYYDNPKVATIWLFATDKITMKDWWVTTKFIEGLMERMLNNGMAHRIQAFSVGWRFHAHKWLERIGLKKEALLKGFSEEDGFDILIFGKIKE